MSKNEVATTTEKKFELVTINGALAEAIQEEMDGLGAIPYDKVKIPSGGGIAFELPGDDEDNPDTAQELIGVILDHHPINAYWKDKFNGGNEQPDCSSFDGKQGVERETGEIHDCATCPHNQFGSDNKGKACKNVHRCYILREGNPVPLVLALPPTSLKHMRDYIAKKVLLQGMRCWEAVTKITLKKEKSADNITYSRAAFAFVSRLSEKQVAEAKTMRDMIMATTRTAATIDDADYNMQASNQKAPQAPPVESSEFVSVDETTQENLPFN